MDRNADRDKVLAASDIVEVVGEHVQLRAKGREFAAVCCFHDDSKPSMFVSPQKQIFKCFACGAGGSVFDFVMRYHKLTFPEALKYLADRAGIELTPWKKRRGGRETEQSGPSLRERLSEANAQALGFYAAMLRHDEHGQQARDYLERRGVSADMVEAFKIGVAPQRWDGLATMVGHKTWDLDVFVAAGLVKPRKGTPAHDEHHEPGQLPKTTPSPTIATTCSGTAWCFQSTTRSADPSRSADAPSTTKTSRSTSTAPSPTSSKKPARSTACTSRRNASSTQDRHHGSRATPTWSPATRPAPPNVRRRAGHRAHARPREGAQAFLREGRAGHGRRRGRSKSRRPRDRGLPHRPRSTCSWPPSPDRPTPDELLKAEGLAAWDAVVDSAKDALAWQFDKLAEGLDASDTVTGRQRLAEAFAQRIVDAGIARAGSLRRSFVVQRLAELLGLDRPGVEQLLDRFRPRRA